MLNASPEVYPHKLRRLYWPFLALAEECRQIVGTVAGSFDCEGKRYTIPRFVFLGEEGPTRPLRIGCFAVLHGDVNNQVVLVPKGSRARSIADLKGKRVGYVRATTSQYFLIRMLEEVGLGWGDITPVAMGVSDGAAAFSQGALDAWAIFGFPIQRAIATEGARLFAEQPGAELDDRSRGSERQDRAGRAAGAQGRRAANDPALPDEADGGEQCQDQAERRGLA